MKRVLLLIATNLAVMVVLSIVVSVLGVDRWLLANGIASPERGNGSAASGSVSAINMASAGMSLAPIIASCAVAPSARPSSASERR